MTELIVTDVRLPYDEYFDEVLIRLVPRFKTSDLSGNEWRRSAQVTLRRKGQTVWEKGYLNLEVAAAFLPGDMIRAGEELVHRDRRVVCMQPGCPNVATVTYRMKHRYYEEHVVDDEGFEYRRHFCDEHAHRGNADFEDCDENYELISGEAADAANIPPDVISQSTLVIIEPDELDDDELLAQYMTELDKRAASVDWQPMCWFVTPDGGDTVEKYCPECIQIHRPGAVIGRDYSSNGTSWTEEDGSRYCDMCGAIFGYTLTDYGVLEELGNFEEVGLFWDRPNECFEMARVANAVPHNDDEMRARVLAVLKAGKDAPVFA